MSAWISCTCEPRDRENYVVMVRKGNYSYFESPKGGFHPSDYSLVKCLKCAGMWRSKAKYIDDLPNLAA